MCEKGSVAASNNLHWFLPSEVGPAPRPHEDHPVQHGRHMAPRTHPLPLVVVGPTEVAAHQGIVKIHLRLKSFYKPI